MSVKVSQNARILLVQKIDVIFSKVSKLQYRF